MVYLIPSGQPHVIVHFRNSNGLNRLYNLYQLIFVHMHICICVTIIMKEYIINSGSRGGTQEKLVGGRGRSDMDTMFTFRILKN